MRLSLGGFLAKATESDPMLSLASLLCIAVVLAAIVVAWRRRFIASGSILVATCLVLVVEYIGPTSTYMGASAPTVVVELALRESNLWQAPSLGALQLVTSMFLHAGLGHFWGNLLVLLAFAFVFEDLLGARRFLVVYLATGIIAALTHVALPGDAGKLSLGASGAIFGVIGAFATAYPFREVRVPLPAFIMLIWVKMPGWIACLVLSVIQLAYMAVGNGLDGVAYFAHLGGAASGAVLGWVMVHKFPARHDTHAMNVTRLEAFGRKSDAQRALEHMNRSKNEPEVYHAWREKFWQHADCPTCGSKVAPRQSKVECTSGHRFSLT